MDFAKAKSGFLTLLSRPHSERAAAMAEICGVDIELRAQLEAWLAANDDLGDFCNVPLPEQPWVFNRPAPASQIGSQFGAYRLVREIGRGGTSLVYLGERKDALLQRTVAIKVVHREFAGDDIERNLQRERQTLANLKHPNIGSLIDAGISGAGLAYLVMEYIDGSPIDVFCTTRGLTVHQRLQLFLSVCDAVSYAHRNLIVHRDLKPTNILVTTDGIPKLIDFGIAKLLSTATIEDETLTAIPRLTPAYASPEQLLGEPITTASDVYSLGLVLYELLTGQRLFNAARRFEAVLDETPAAPSKVKRELSRDLDAIVLMALRREPHRRYATVDQFRMDLVSCLADQPVTARPDTLAYRASKFLRRYRIASAAAAVALVTLMAGVTSTLIYARRAEQRRAEGVFMTTVVLRRTSSMMMAHPGTLSAQKYVLSKGIEYVRSLMASAPNLELEDDYRIMLGELATVLGHPEIQNLGDTAAAYRLLSESIPITEKIVTLNPGKDVYTHGVPTIHCATAAVLLEMGDVTKALQHLRRAVEIDDRVPFGYYPDPAHRLYSRAASNYYLAEALAEAGDESGSERASQTALGILHERVSRFHDDNSKGNLAAGLYHCALSAKRFQPAKALARFEESLSVWTEIHGNQSDNFHARWYQGKLLYEIGALKAAHGAVSAGLRDLDRSIQDLRSDRGLEREAWSITRPLAKALTARSLLLAREGRIAEAQAGASEAVDLATAASTHDPASQRARDELESAKQALAAVRRPGVRPR